MALITTRPLESVAQIQTIEPLLAELSKDIRLTDIELQPFLREDTRELLAKSIGCDGNLIDEQVLQLVFEQSGGLPFFCSEVIKDIVEKDMILIRNDGSMGWRDTKVVDVSIMLFSYHPVLLFLLTFTSYYTQ